MKNLALQLQENERVDVCDAEKEFKPWKGTTGFQRATSADVERHIPLARKMLTTYNYGSDLSYEEQFASALVGIAVALERYEPSRGVKESYWIAYQIDRAIRNDSRQARRQRKRWNQAPEQYDAFESQNDRENELERNEQRRVMRREVEAAMARLPERERRIVEKIYLEGKTQTEVAREEGMTQSWVSRLCKSALAKLRRAASCAL